MFFILQAIGSGNYLRAVENKRPVITPDLQQAKVFKAILYDGKLKVVDDLPSPDDIGQDWIPRSVQVHLV